MPPSDELIMPRLSRKQLDLYHENGYLLVKDALCDEDLAPVRAAMMDTVDGIARTLINDGLLSSDYREAPFETRLAKIFADAGVDQAPRFGRSWRERKPAYFELLTHPKVLDIAESIVGPEVLIHPIYNTRPMIPDTPLVVVPWHQDIQYLDADLVAGLQIPTLWIPLVDVTHEMGCLQVGAKTKARGVAPWHREDRSGTGFIEIDDEHMEGVEVVTCEMTRGSILLVDQMTYHRSTANTTDRVRWSVDLRYQATGHPTGFRDQEGWLARSAARPGKVVIWEQFAAET